MSAADLFPLFDSALTFSATAAALSTIPAPDQFHLLFLLLDFLTSPDPPDLSNDPKHYENWMCARMKAEWCLWEGYSKWDINLNPFLGHFVEVWQARHSKQRVTGDTMVVGVILSGQAKEVLLPCVG